MSYKTIIEPRNATSVNVQQRKDQVKNSDGAFVFEITPKELYDRFLILGTAENTYYASAKDLTTSAIKNFDKLLAEEGEYFVERAVGLSTENRIPKNSTALLALAYAIAFGDLNTKNNVVESLPKVARTASDLFLFVEYATLFRGWGKKLREAVSNWYLSQGVDQMAYQMLKYQGRKRDINKGTDKKYTHAALLKLAHVKPDTKTRNEIFRWARGYEINHTYTSPILSAYEHGIKKINDVNELAQYIRVWNEDHPYKKITHEFIPSQWLSEKAIWEALLPAMPIGALIRNLGRLTSYGIFDNSSNLKSVVEYIENPNAIKGGRMHPVTILGASVQYAKGRANYGNMSWRPRMRISDALETAFYNSFQYMTPLNQKIFIALDVSASMTWGQVNGLPFNPMQASAAMMMTYVNKEEDVTIGAFSSGRRYTWQDSQRDRTSLDGITIMSSIGRRSSLEDVMAQVNKMPHGATNISLPMLYATANNMDVDVFMIFTDNELNTGSLHPFQALNEYRYTQNKPKAALIVNAMTATNFTIADPNDPYSLDVCGFDSATPMVIEKMLSKFGEQ